MSRDSGSSGPGWVPEIGMPLTISVGSDSYPYEVVEVSTGKVNRAVVRAVKPIGMAHWTEGCFTDRYESVPDGECLELSDRGNHGWHVIGDYRSRTRGWCYVITFGRARYYRDPCFRWVEIHPTHTP